MTKETQNPDEIPVHPRNPYYVFLSVFTALALIALSMWGYFTLIHPEPNDAVALADVRALVTESLRQPFTSHDPKEVKQVVEDARVPLKQVANFIATQACPNGDSLCQSKALFYFVRDRIQYVSDPKFHDELENPLAVLKTGGADCEDMAVLLIALEKAIGNDTRLVYTPDHAYAEVRVPDYNDRWLPLDPTCKFCKFNDLPESSALVLKEFYEL